MRCLPQRHRPAKVGKKVGKEKGGMIPKVLFSYSPVYDQKITEIVHKVHYDYGTFPAKARQYIKKTETAWRKIAAKILLEMPKVCGLKWRRDIICYVVTRDLHTPFSTPLTIGFMRGETEITTERFWRILVHELVHVLTMQQERKTVSKAFSNIHSKYAKESIVTQNHILVDAVLWHIYLKFFGEKVLKQRIEIESGARDYKKAWQIVEKEGYKNILAEFGKHLKGK